MQNSSQSSFESFDTPILLCLFNRPDLARESINALRKIRPRKLYVSVDGPRPTVDTDAAKCAEVRNEVALIDWPCLVETRFSSTNQGCGRAVSSAIDWLFEHEEEGIILEDDVLPVQYFFIFAQEMLERFRFCDDVFMISGTNIFPRKTTEDNFIYTRFPAAWGWATWRRSWQDFDYQLADWRIPSVRAEVTSSIQGGIARSYLVRCFDDVVDGLVDTWDYQWLYSGIRKSKLGVTSGQNLVTNVGIDGTHSNGATKSHFLKTSSDFTMNINLKDPHNLSPEKNYDRAFITFKALPIVIKRKLKACFKVCNAKWSFFKTKLKLNT